MVGTIEGSKERIKEKQKKGRMEERKKTARSGEGPEAPLDNTTSLYMYTDLYMYMYIYIHNK